MKHSSEQPTGAWYIEAGAGMAEALRIANEKRAYTLSDRGTFLAQRKRLVLEILTEGDSQLRNEYSVIVVKGGKRVDRSRQFSEFLLKPDPQVTISKFGVQEFGQPLFFSNRKNIE